MDLNYIDLTANRGDSLLHQSSALAKIIVCLCMLIATIFANTPTELLILLAILLGGYILAQIPLHEMAHYALYPAFFSLAFALFQFTYSFNAGILVILRAVTAAMALLLLIFTTPYPQIFGILQRFLPKVLVDGMFFTYRIFFILLKEIKNLLTSIKLKGSNAPRQLIRNLHNLAGALGVLFVHSFEMSERMYQVLIIRGYTGHLQIDEHQELKGIDLLFLATGLAVILMVVII